MLNQVLSVLGNRNTSTVCWGCCQHELHSWFSNFTTLCSNIIEGEVKIFGYVHREFSYESTCEKILKIGPHLMKLLSNIKGYTFLRHSVHCVSKTCDTIFEDKFVYKDFWHTYYQDYRLSTSIFSFPPHLFRAAILPWEAVETYVSRI